MKIEPTQKRIRTQIRGVTIADSTDVLMVWEIPYFPTYYFPQSDVRMDLMTDSGETKQSASRGTANLFDIAVGDHVVPRAARVWNDAKTDELTGSVSLVWKAMDAWFEEDEEVIVHARDPYTRLDILQSSRHISVEVDGVVVAESDHPRILFETGLPARYYLPKTDVRFEYLRASDTVTSCPYKGHARYWTIEVNDTSHEDLAWGYDTPLREAQEIAGFVAFYNEKVDITIDAVRAERPTTQFG
ncbi:MAG: DUF427 domain-containing protein [Acidimicrobiia bacterium]